MIDTMKFLLVHNHYNQKGGEDAIFKQEAELLREAGHYVIEYRRSNDELKELGLQQKLKVPARLVWASDTVKELRSLIQKEDPDVAHFHNTFMMISPAAYYACHRAGVPVVQTLHNYRLLCPAATFYRDGHVCEDCLGKTPPWPGVLHACYRSSRTQTAAVAAMLTFHRWLRTWNKKVDLYVALTEFAKRKFVEGGLPEERIVVKPNFVHPDPGAQEKNDGYALFVGRLSPEKGLKTLFKAWGSLKGMPLKIAGDGPLMSQIKESAAEQKLNSIEILGNCSHEKVIALMKSARFLVFPSEWYEGFPVSIAEAFACGKPVIASKLGAMAELIEDGKTGLLFEPGNSEDLARKVMHAFENPDLCRRMGLNARAEYEAKYTAKINYMKLMEIYDKVLTSKFPSPLSSPHRGEGRSEGGKG